MNRFKVLLFTILLLIICAIAFGYAREIKKDAVKTTKPLKSDKIWQDTFPVDKKSLGPTGTNEYFPLKPGEQQIYQEGKTTLTRTFLTETKMIDSVEVGVVEDKEVHDNQLVAIAYDYYAIDTITKNVYYFGEDVDNYKDGKVVNHWGSWLSGVNGAKFGLLMPGKIKVGDKFYQELAPKIALDRAEIVGTNETVKTPAGIFTNCIKVEETSGLEKGAKDYKWYAPGIGMIKDNDMILIKIENLK